MTTAPTAAHVESDLVLLGGQFDSKDDAIHAAVRLLVDAGAVTPEYLDDVEARERVTSSYIGNHVAIPHGLDTTREHILRSAISIVQVPDGVSFGAEDAHLVIGIAGKGGEHTDLLAALAAVLLDEENVEALRRAETVDEVNAILGGAEL
jgi:mannitol PTS system EIIA component